MKWQTMMFAAMMVMGMAACSSSDDDSEGGGSEGGGGSALSTSIKGINIAGSYLGVDANGQTQTITVGCNLTSNNATFDVEKSGQGAKIAAYGSQKSNSTQGIKIEIDNWNAMATGKAKITSITFINETKTSLMGAEITTYSTVVAKNVPGTGYCVFKGTVGGGMSLTGAGASVSKYNGEEESTRWQSKNTSSDNLEVNIYMN